MILDDVKNQVWAILYALEYHRLRQDDGKVATALSWIGEI